MRKFVAEYFGSLGLHEDWVPVSRNMMEVVEAKCRGRKTWEECLSDDMVLLGLQLEWAIFRGVWRDLIWGKRLTLAQHEN